MPLFPHVLICAMALTLGSQAKAEGMPRFNFSDVNNSRYEQYMNDPVVQKALQDPKVQERLKSPEMQNLISDPDVRRKLSSPELRNELREKYLDSGELPSAESLTSPGSYSTMPVPSLEPSSKPLDNSDYDNAFRLSP